MKALKTVSPLHVLSADPFNFGLVCGLDASDEPTRKPRRIAASTWRFWIAGKDGPVRVYGRKGTVYLPAIDSPTIH